MLHGEPWLKKEKKYNLPDCLVFFQPKSRMTLEETKQYIANNKMEKEILDMWNHGHYLNKMPIMCKYDLVRFNTTRPALSGIGLPTEASQEGRQPVTARIIQVNAEAMHMEVVNFAYPFTRKRIINLPISTSGWDGWDPITFATGPEELTQQLDALHIDRQPEGLIEQLDGPPEHLADQLGALQIEDPPPHTPVPPGMNYDDGSSGQEKATQLHTRENQEGFPMTQSSHGENRNHVNQPPGTWKDPNPDANQREGGWIYPNPGGHHNMPTWQWAEVQPGELADTNPYLPPTIDRHWWTPEAVGRDQLGAENTLYQELVVAFMRRTGVFQTFPPTTPDIWHTNRLAGEIQGPASFPLTWGGIVARGWVIVHDSDPTLKRYCIIDMVKIGNRPEDSVPISSQFDYQNVPLIDHPRPADPTSLANRVAVLARIGERIDTNPRWGRACVTHGFGMIPQHIPIYMDITERNIISGWKKNWLTYVNAKLENPPTLDELCFKMGRMHQHNRQKRRTDNADTSNCMSSL